MLNFLTLLTAKTPAEDGINATKLPKDPQSSENAFGDLLSPESEEEVARQDVGLETDKSTSPPIMEAPPIFASFSTVHTSDTPVEIEYALATGGLADLTQAPIPTEISPPASDPVSAALVPSLATEPLEIATENTTSIRTEHTLPASDITTTRLSVAPQPDAKAPADPTDTSPLTLSPGDVTQTASISPTTREQTAESAPSTPTAGSASAPPPVQGAQTGLSVASPVSDIQPADKRPVSVTSIDPEVAQPQTPAVTPSPASTEPTALLVTEGDPNAAALPATGPIPTQPAPTGNIDRAKVAAAAAKETSATARGIAQATGRGSEHQIAVEEAPSGSSRADAPSFAMPASTETGQLATQALSTTGMTAPLTPSSSQSLTTPTPGATPATATPLPPMPPQAVAGVITERLVNEPDNAERITVQLDPPELGRVAIDFKFDAHGLQAVTITGETPDALKQLRLMHFELVQALEKHGIAGGDLNFAEHSFQQSQQGQFGFSGTAPQDPVGDPDYSEPQSLRPVNYAKTESGLDLKL